MLEYSFIFITLIRQISGQQPVEFRIVPAYMRDPELLVEWPTPPNIMYKKEDNWWADYKEFADYLGLLFAGKTEFPWIVDIRVEGENQESWAIGNLLTANHVATSCRTMRFFEIAHALSDIKVLYCMQIFDEVALLGEPQATGARWVKNFTLHKNCATDPGASDIAVLTLDKIIEPIPPYIGYMPFPYDKTHSIIPPVNLKRQLSQRMVCYVASYGKRYVNKLNHMVLNFKVKYRVYYYPWHNCYDRINILCSKRDKKCVEAVTRNDIRVVCMRTRAIVGTVCDHDRGAPVVCDGLVQGFVVRGAPLEHCNNRLPVPFIISNLYFLQNYLRPYMELFPSDCRCCKPYSKASNVHFSWAALLTLLLSVFYVTNSRN